MAFILHMIMKRRLKVTHPQRDMHPGGLIEVANISEKNQPLLPSYRPAHFISFVSGISHVMNFVRRLLIFSFIMSWAAYLCCIYMVIKPLLLVSLSH